MLLATPLQRVFLFTEKGQQVRLADPDPQWTPQAVMNYYAGTYPILATARVSSPQISGDEVCYRFESMMGTKG